MSRLPGWSMRVAALGVAGWLVLSSPSLFAQSGLSTDPRWIEFKNLANKPDIAGTFVLPNLHKLYAAMVAQTRTITLARGTVPGTRLATWQLTTFGQSDFRRAAIVIDLDAIERSTAPRFEGLLDSKDTARRVGQVIAHVFTHALTAIREPGVAVADERARAACRDAARLVPSPPNLGSLCAAADAASRRTEASAQSVEDLVHRELVSAKRADP